MILPRSASSTTATSMSSATMDTGGVRFPASPAASASSTATKQHYSVSMHEAPPDRSTPVLIHTPRAASSFGAIVPSMDCHLPRRLDKREYRSLSGDWINSPLLESFASFHNALNIVNLHDNSPTGFGNHSSNGHLPFGNELPYIGAYWPHGHEDEASSMASSQSTFCSSNEATAAVDSISTRASAPTASSLAMEDWDLLKMRSLSTDYCTSSPMPMDNFVPFLFPMDSDQGHGSSEDPRFQEPHHSLPPPLPQLLPQLHHPVVPEAFPAGSHDHGRSNAYVDAGIHEQTQWLPSDHHHQQHLQYQHQLQPPNRSVSPMHHHATPYTDALPQLIVFSPPAPRQIHSSLQQAKPPRVPSPSRQLPMSRGVRPGPPPGLPLADVELLTKLNSCYWKNGRKNLQCFPICPEHNDFYSMKMTNRKHTSVGVCRGPVYTHVFLPASNKPPSTSRTMGQHMKYEYGVGASGSGGSAHEVFVLGKFERVPQRNDNDELEQLLPTPAQFASSVSFESFRYSCFQAVEMEERRLTTRSAQSVAELPDHIVRSTWFFLPDVWKVQPMLKKKRKATRSAPAQAFPFCFRVFVYIRDPSNNDDDSTVSFRCIAHTTSAFFELYSTRTVDRVKRKYWGKTEDDEQEEDAPIDAMVSTTPSAIHVAKRPTTRS